MTKRQSTHSLTLSTTCNCPFPLKTLPDAHSEPKHLKAQNSKLNGEKGMKIIQSFRELVAAGLEGTPGSVVTARDRIIHLDVHCREKEPGSGTSGEPGKHQHSTRTPRETQGEGTRRHPFLQNQPRDTHRGGQEIKAKNIPRNTSNKVLHVSM